MKNKTRNGKAPLTPGRILYRLLSGFLILIFLIAVAAGIGQIRDRLSPDGYDYYEESYYLNRLRNEDFAGLLEMTRDDVRSGKVYEGDIPQCRALAMYYEAAMFRHAYEKAGDEEKAGMQKERMDRFAREAGEYDYYTEKIDALFEREP
jgi:hypothetical protein